MLAYHISIDVLNNSAVTACFKQSNSLYSWYSSERRKYLKCHLQMNIFLSDNRITKCTHQKFIDAACLTFFRSFSPLYVKLITISFPLSDLVVILFLTWYNLFHPVKTFSMANVCLADSFFPNNRLIENIRI